jgi:hypothetical protein
LCRSFTSILFPAVQKAIVRRASSVSRWQTAEHWSMSEVALRFEICNSSPSAALNQWTWGWSLKQPCRLYRFHVPHLGGLNRQRNHAIGWQRIAGLAHRFLGTAIFLGAHGWLESAKTHVGWGAHLMSRGPGCLTTSAIFRDVGAAFSISCALTSIRPRMKPQAVQTTELAAINAFGSPAQRRYATRQSAAVYLPAVRNGRCVARGGHIARRIQCHNTRLCWGDSTRWFIARLLVPIHFKVACFPPVVSPSTDVFRDYA